jgi:hypothetical protein
MIPLSRYDNLRIAPPPFWGEHGGRGDDECGCFRVGKLAVIATVGDGWEHLSVSLEHRCPTWDEMSAIAHKFFGDAPAMQLHVPAAAHVNCHPNCLHWWRPIGREIPLPPGWMVGPKESIRRSGASGE